jgi:hypothetical protein
MNRYKINYVMNGEQSHIYITCHDEDMAIMFFEISLEGALFLSIERAVVQITTHKPCLN